LKPQKGGKHCSNKRHDNMHPTAGSASTLLASLMPYTGATACFSFRQASRRNCIDHVRSLLTLPMVFDLRLAGTFDLEYRVLRRLCQQDLTSKKGQRTHPNLLSPLAGTILPSVPPSKSIGSAPGPLQKPKVHSAVASVVGKP
jgi:hypothetical protein